MTGLRQGTNWVSTNGATANFIFLDGGTFWVPICQNRLKLITFAATPFVLTLFVRDQGLRQRGGAAFECLITLDSGARTGRCLIIVSIILTMMMMMMVVIIIIISIIIISMMMMMMMMTTMMMLMMIMFLIIINISIIIIITK